MFTTDHCYMARVCIQASQLSRVDSWCPPPLGREKSLSNFMKMCVKQFESKNGNVVLVCETLTRNITSIEIISTLYGGTMIIREQVEQTETWSFLKTTNTLYSSRVECIGEPDISHIFISTEKLSRWR